MQIYTEFVFDILEMSCHIVNLVMLILQYLFSTGLGSIVLFKILGLGQFGWVLDSDYLLIN